MSQTDQWMDEIRKLDQLRNDKLISGEEYDRQRNILMENRDAISLSIEEGAVGVSAWARLGCALLDGLLFTVTLGIGWIIWAFTLNGSGQTPSRKLLNHTVIDLDTGNPMKLGRMFWMRYFIGTLVANFAFLFTIGILCFMPFWDKRNQNIWDKVSNSLVIETPKNVL
ncbi:MAG: RDD family protein [Acidimicrobiales bacterium]|jgi:uncharacterized RDD family membrane protein YckC|nr:RDD family protein [Acidimicrobiales bacterium]MDP6299165.1 RDD family protein [Acidimicrobiales bacterium]HJM28923.1 RDD family protein [Acidimicrobiales bacterium]